MAQENSSRLIAQDGVEEMASFTPNAYTQTIWNFLLGFIGNEVGVAGLMGNLYHESHCYPNMLYGDTAPPTEISINYTTRVDSHAMSREEFVSGRAYGLAQWLSRNRKENLYDGVWQTGGSEPSSGNSIGSLTRGLNMIQWELTEGGYQSTLEYLQSATSIDNATRRVFDYYEGAGDDTLFARQTYAQEIYDTYGSGGGLFITTAVSGNGTITVSDYTPEPLQEITLSCIPASGETLLNIDARIISSQQSVALSLVEVQTFPMPTESISILAEFTGTTPVPPIPPVPTYGKRKRKMPIWLYPIFRNRKD